MEKLIHLFVILWSMYQTRPEEPLSVDIERQWKAPETTTVRVPYRTGCYVLAKNCMKAHELGWCRYMCHIVGRTGSVCGRSIYYRYYTFKSFCFLDFVNCMENYDVWQAMHMGICIKPPEVSGYEEISFNDDYVMEQYYAELT